MARSKTTTAAQNFKAIIEETARLSRETIVDGGLSPGQRLLSEWQVQRLSCTYEDFRRQRQYRKAVDFFLSDIYGPVDFSQRDSDIARVFPLMVKVLSDEAIDSLAKGLKLNAMTVALDHQLVEVLENDLGLDAQNNPERLDFEMYAEAYRRCDNYAQRKEQIDGLVEVGANLEVVARKRMILATVKIARKPAQLAGFSELQSFIERGLAAFKAMKNSQLFLETIHSRELRILDAIYAEEEIPSDIAID